ncbi:MAG: helix-turn-helix domain-containing protein [bacterium]|nr:helix-turn-helix domain-containing protein [bacterium]
MRSTLNSNELYLLHPIAWSEAQEILAHEVAMIGSGSSSKKRLEFLKQECSRRQQVAAVSLPETIEAVFTDLSRPELLANFSAMRERFHMHGVSGTLRSIRNLNRRLGMDSNVIDQTTIFSGMMFYKDDEPFMSALTETFGPLINELLAHPIVTAGEATFNEINNEPLLPSHKGKKLEELGIDVMRRAIDDLGDIPMGSRRQIAYLRGRLLDIELTDQLSVLVSHIEPSAFKMMVHSIMHAMHTQYCDILAETMAPRVSELTHENGHQEAPTDPNPIAASSPKSPSTPNESAAPSPLLSISEAMAALNVSRSTVLRLVDDGALTQIKVRNRSMITSKSLEAYITQA